MQNTTIYSLLKFQMTGLPATCSLSPRKHWTDTWISVPLITTKLPQPYTGYLQTMDQTLQSEQNCCQCKYHTLWADGQNNIVYFLIKKKSSFMTTYLQN